MAKPKKTYDTATDVNGIEAQVTAHLPLTVDLMRLNSRNDLRFVVKSGGTMTGTLQIGRGSVQWFKAKAKLPTGSWAWRDFAKLLEG